MMPGLYKVGRSGSEDRISAKKIVLYVICFGFLLLISTVLQTTCLSVFGIVPGLTFALTCAIGFICGDKAGAIFGILAGFSIDFMGNAGISLSPLLYMFCGYLCGAAIGWFLSRNLPSFVVYSVIAGVLKEIFVLICYGLFSEEFGLGNLIVNLLLPDYFAYLICILPAYGAVFGIHTLIKGKNKRKKQRFH